MDDNKAIYYLINIWKYSSLSLEKDQITIAAFQSKKTVWASGFVAKFMTFENSAQLEQGQAAALVSESDHSAFFRCVFIARVPRHSLS
ncbi:hypothetical protein L1049_017603 [Liquidambar formosana]|uniref:Pectinesterase catalytic domain-containing protein n=1 Tax=Liquidambar formosana TaxID=63359 RepID=A0AAP0S807_LIQFO